MFATCKAATKTMWATLNILAVVALERNGKSFAVTVVKQEGLPEEMLYAHIQTCLFWVVLSQVLGEVGFKSESRADEGLRFIRGK